MILYVTFDIADQSFTYFTEEQWDTYMRDIRTSFFEDGYMDAEAVANMDWHELIECYHGEEMFWEAVDTNHLKN